MEGCCKEMGVRGATHQLRAAHSMEPAGHPALATCPDVVLKLEGQGNEVPGPSSSVLPHLTPSILTTEPPHSFKDNTQGAAVSGCPREQLMFREVLESSCSSCGCYQS